MKTPRMANAIGYIDEDLIAGAACQKTEKQNTVFKWCAIAACVAAILAVVLTVAPMIGRDDPIVSGPPVIEGTFAPTEPPKYYAYGIAEGAFSAYTGGKTIDADRVGNKLEDVVVTAGWKNEAGEWISSENLNAEVYAIEGIESDAAVALKFTDAGETVTTTQYYVIAHPNAGYRGMVFPNYSKENPVRYLEEGAMGKSNGWQDFGTTGEIRTITVPVGSIFVYQMYSYYIRNDLRHIYSAEELPNKLEDLPAWLADTEAEGRKAFWYSMGRRLPEHIAVEGRTAIAAENGAMQFVSAEYKVRLDGKEENWVVYFIEEDGVYSAFALEINQNYAFVKSYSESIVKSYQKKP